MLFKAPILLGLLAALAIHAETSLKGTVVDPAGAPIPAATVALNGLPPVLTDEQGAFVFTLRPGAYKLVIAKEGFSDSAQTLDLPSDGLALRLVLSISPVSSAVTVHESRGYITSDTASSTKTLTPLRDVPQSITIVNSQQIQDQMMTSIADVVRYVPGISSHQGENNRDQLVIRGNSTSADFFVNGVRDDVQYYRDLYNLESVEALKGPNALIFGRGGAGGVINRVTKEAGFTPLREFTLEGGSFNNKRFSTDLNQPINDKVALRLNGLYENSDGFRNFAHLERYGVSPALTWTPTDRTKIAVAYENFHDFRVADRGISSFRGRPVDLDIATYIGNPDDSHVRANVNLGSVLVEHQIGRLTLRNRTQFGNYDRGYQNYVPGVINADKSLISISAYNNATARLNMFNQTDATYTVNTGVLRHTLLGGIEIGRQLTDNFRNTGYFNNTATSILAPLSDTVVTTPVIFRQSATDANNHLKLDLGAVYLQDQVQVSRFIQLIGGLRLDHFDLRYHDNRTGNDLRRIDNLVSPRAGIVFKPVAAVSLYGSYSISYLPSSGDQFSSLTTITQQVKPEKFSNYELGVKWQPARTLSINAAVYRLDRTNTRSTDPNDPTRIVQTGSQRTNGFEIGANGNLTRAWRVAGGYAYQDAFVTNATVSAFAGAQVAQVPHNTFSLWNHYQFIPRLSGGLGLVNRSDMFAAIDNTVTLPGYTRADCAVFFRFTERLRLQANIENITGRRYYVNADSNSNISPGSPRSARIGLVARF